jgi:hypothetical protein
MKPINKTAEHLLSILENTTYADGIRSYSGRGMNGALCLGVEVERNELFCLGFEMARALYRDLDPGGSITPAPFTDNMGGDIIAYWPSAKVQETEEVDE